VSVVLQGCTWEGYPYYCREETAVGRGKRINVSQQNGRNGESVGYRDTCSSQSLLKHTLESSQGGGGTWRDDRVKDPNGGLSAALHSPGAVR